MMTFYDCSTAPSPRRARILLAEKGAHYETIAVDLRQGEQLSPAFQLINPLSTVPALKTESGIILTDNAGISAYLEAVYPAPALMGITPEEKAEIASWNWRVEFEGLLAVAEALRNSAPAMKQRALPGPVNYEQIPALAERGLARIQQFFFDLNTHLEKREFIATERFSLVDITAVVAVDFARVVKLKADERYPHVQRWRALMAQRPAMSL